MGRVRKVSDETKAWVDRHEAHVARFNQALAEAIRYSIRDTTISAFAKEIHYTRTTLTTLLNQDAAAKKQKPWTLSNLLAIAEARGFPLSALIQEAELILAGGTPGLILRMAGTRPRSRERLQRLVFEAVGYSGDVDKDKFDGLLEVTYRLVDIECGNTEFCGRYYTGELSDSEALALLKKAAELPPAENMGAYPLWAALKKVYDEERQ